MELSDSETATRYDLQRIAKHVYADSDGVLRFIDSYTGARTRFTVPTTGAQHGGQYPSVTLFGVPYFTHVLAYALHCGRWPIGGVAHSDGDTRNNRMDNLCDTSSFFFRFLNDVSGGYYNE